MVSRLWACVCVYFAAVTSRGSVTRIAAPMPHGFPLRPVFCPKVLPQQCDLHLKNRLSAESRFNFHKKRYSFYHELRRFAVE